MRNLKNMARKLPEYTIGGTLFTVDGRIYEFRETAAPWNQISMDNFWENEPTHILFDKQTNNIYNGTESLSNKPDTVELIIVPPLMELDPVGLARRYNVPDETYIPKHKRKQVLGEQMIGLQQNERKHKNGKGIK
jgi:hypothetical protein